MTDNSILNLLSQVKTINSKYAELAKLTGENFNVFSIMRIEGSEVNTHSAFLAELLNPKGCHDQGGIFLKLFINYLNSINEGLNLNLPDFDFENANTVVEKYIGEINKDGTKGGRIDIHCEDNASILMIENKIYAGDQPNQLLRYHNYGIEKQPKHFRLLYLTLEDKLILDFTAGNSEDVKKSVIQITYKKHIIEWLELCKKEAVNFPVLRETITQYINLIKRLTKQTINHKMSTELVNMLTLSAENFNAAKNISQEFENAKKEIYNHFWNKVINILKTKFGQEWESYVAAYGYTICNNHNNMVGYGIDNTKEGKLFCGICWLWQLGSYKKYYEKKIKEIYGQNYIVANGYWINYKNLESFNLFETSFLKNFLPLNNIALDNEVNRIAEMIFEYFSFDKHKQFIDETSKFINEKYFSLEQVQKEIALLPTSRRLIKNEIYIQEGHILFQEILLNDKKKIAIDTFLSEDNKWRIEIFIRELENKVITDNTLKNIPFFKNLNAFDRNNQRIIYKEFQEENLQGVVDSLKNLISCITTDLEAEFQNS